MAQTGHPFAASRDYLWNRRLMLTAALLFPLAVVVLYAIPPTEDSFYPKCTFHKVTGLHCPGCGGTRSVHALLHGDLAQAAAYNLIVVLAVPCLACWGLWAGYRKLNGTLPEFPRLPAWGVRLMLVFLMAYWICRNLPFAPFNLLAPHPL